MSQPVPRPFNTHGCGTQQWASRGFKLACGGRIKRVQHSHGGAIQRGIQFSPLAGRNDWSSFKAHGLQHAANSDGIDGEDFTHHRHGWRTIFVFKAFWARYGPGCDLIPSIAQHGASEDVFGFSVGWHAETRHINPNDANAVDLLWE